MKFWRRGMAHMAAVAGALSALAADLPPAPGSMAAEKVQSDTDKAMQDFSAQGIARMLQAVGDQAPTGADGAAPPHYIPELPRSPTSGAIVRLPPYIVTETTSRIHWSYAAIPGYEILSCCNAADTQKFALDIARQQAWLDQMLPPQFQAGHSVPTAFIVLNDSVARAMTNDIAALTNQTLAQMVQAEKASGPSIYIPQLKLTDDDSVDVDVIYNYHPKSFVELDPSYVLAVLSSRAPPLPTWFSVGVYGLYQDCIAADDSGANNGTFLLGESRLHFAPGLWVNQAATDYLADHAGGGLFPGHGERAELIPMRTFLAAPPPPSGSEAEKIAWFARVRGRSGESPERMILARGADPDSPWRHDAWQSQATLFIRWALDDSTGGRAASLWRFVTRTEAAPVSEELFAACFGFGFEAMDHQLAEYLPGAVQSPLTLVAQGPIDPPSIDPQEATEGQRARILGDWERKEYDYVRPSNPAYAAKYAEQANRTLMRGYDSGDRDPALLAALGLFECATGDDGLARRYLEAAVQSRVERPRAYVELGRILLHDAAARPAGTGGRLNRAQVAAVVNVLQSAHSLQPPLLGTYLFAADAWEHADFIPTATELRWLDEGMYYFPADSRLILAGAQLDAAAGLKTEAIRVIDRGLGIFHEPAMRAVLLRLRGRYADN